LALKFFIVLGVLHLLILTPPGQVSVDWLVGLHARTSAAVLGFLGIGTEVQNATIVAESNALTVIGGCSALEIWFFLVAAIIAFPSGILSKLVGVVVALAAVQILNSVRITSLFWMGHYSAQNFSLLHEGMWPSILNFSAILIFGCWLAWATRIEHRR